jgi:hypothetical protein
MLTFRRSGGVQLPLPATHFPATSISPASGSSKPAIRRSSVVLPQPDGPRSATNSPRSMQSRASSTAWTAPYRFETAWQQIIPQAM